MENENVKSTDIDKLEALVLKIAKNIGKDYHSMDLETLDKLNSISNVISSMCGTTYALRQLSGLDDSE